MIVSLGEVSTTWYILNLNLNLCCISVIFRGWRCYFNVGSDKTLIFSPTEISLVIYAICTCTCTGSNPFYIKEILISPRIFKPSCTVQGSVKAGAKPVIHLIDVCTCFSYMICNNSAVLHHGNLTALVHDYVKSFLKKVVRFSIF